MPLKGEAKRQHNKSYYEKNKDTIMKKNKEYYQLHKDWLKIKRILPVGVIY